MFFASRNGWIGEKLKKLKEWFRKLKTNMAVNIVASIVGVLVLFGVLAQSLGYVQFSQEFTDEYSENALRVADAAASYVNADQLDADLADHGASEEHRAASAMLTNLCNKVNAQFIYVIRPDESFDHITFIYNCVNEESGFEAYEVGYVRDTTNSEYKEKYQRLYSGESNQEIVVRDKGFIESGSHITAMIPLKSEGKVVGILCVQRQMDALTKARHSYMVNMGIVVVVLVIFVSLAYSLYLRMQLINPLRKITNETMRFAAYPERAEHPLSDTIRIQNEIGLLAESVDKMENETLSYIENLTEVTAERQRIGTELAVASAIQQAMLTSVAPDRNDISVYATMTPAKEVGGDFYDFFMIDDDHICLTIADVSGKGVPASLFMAITKVLITDSTSVYRSPAEILVAVNERICRNNKLDMFVTVWLGILELSTGKLIASNAGHEYPAVGRSGERFELLKDKHGLVIGAMSGIPYRDYELTLHPGDALFLYTDGVPEATDKEEELFGIERMLSALNVDPAASPEKLTANVKSAVDAFVAEAPQFDDLTTLCIRYHGPQKS